LFEFTRLGVQGFEFFVECFKLFLEVLVAHLFTWCDAHVATGVERPTLRFNFLEHGGVAQTRNVDVFRFSAEDLSELRFGLAAAKSKIWLFAAIEPDYVRNEADLRGCPVTMGTVDLSVDVPGIDEKDGVFPRRRSFSFIEEPERCLLYTSPSPRDLSTSRMPSSA